MNNDCAFLRKLLEISIVLCCLKSATKIVEHVGSVVMVMMQKRNMVGIDKPEFAVWR